MRVCLFASVVGLLSVTLLFAACGGSNQTDAKAPDTPPATTATGGPSTTQSTTTTTTTTLGDGGDLQGAKLGSSTSTVIDNSSPATPKTTGKEPGRAREDIQAIIVARRDEARACYDEGLKTNPTMEGDLDIKWTIDPDGNVTDPKPDDAKSTIHDKATSDCIIAIIRRVHFAKSTKGFESHVHYPFNFHPKMNQVGKGGAQPQQP